MTKVHHILFLPAWYPNENDPMFGLFIQRHAETLALENKVSVICFEALSSNKRTRQITVSEENNVWVARVRFSKSQGLWGRFSYAVDFMVGMHKAFALLRKKRGKPDMSIVNVLTRMGFIALVVKLLYKVPFVIVEHWSRYLPYPGTYRGIFRKRMTRFIVQHSSGLASVSEYLLEAMKKHGLHHSNSMVIGNVVNCEIFKPVVKPSYTNRIQFISISCFEDKSKNLSGLLHALKILKSQRNDFVCVMAGTGQDFNYIKTLSEELQLNDCLVFTGLIQGEEVADLINDSAFLVVSSRYENMPVVINEAFCCGKPVVSSRVGGIHEFLNQERGILVEPENDKALSEALSYMLDHYHQFNPTFIRDFAVKRFSPEAVRKQFTRFTQIASADD